MGGDGGTLSSAGVVPEVIMKIHNAARAGDWDTAKHGQFKLLDLFSLMINAPNFPEGFRLGYQLRGFDTGNARFPLSREEQRLMGEIRSRIACVLAECGFSEAAHACVNKQTSSDPLRGQIEEIVRRVMASI